MRTPEITFRPAARAVGLLLLCGLMLPAWAEAEQAEEDPLFKPMEQKLLGMRNQIKNAQAKLRNNVVDGRVLEGDSRQPQEVETPATRCCRPNLNKLATQVNELSAALDELTRHYEGVPSREGLQAVQQARGDLKQLADAVGAFRHAATPQKANAAMDGVTRAYLLLRDSADALKACCGSSPATR